MIIDRNSPLFSKVELLDEMGKNIDHAFSFDTKTKLAGIYLAANSNEANRFVVNNNQVEVVWVKLPKAKLVYKETGVEIK